MEDNCSILLLSCDKYVDVAEGNLRLLEKYWSECPFDIYVSLEHNELKYKGNLNVHSLKSDNILWTKRVMEHLKIAHGDYVLITLDDFFVEKDVNRNLIMEAIEVLKKNSNIANIAFAHFIGEKIESKKIEYFQCRKKNRPSLLNWQIGVWNKQALLSLLKEDENPWQSELYGSERAKYCFSYDFYCISDDSLMPLKYGRGWLIVRGKWNSNEVERIERECEIDINLQNRTIEDIHEIATDTKSRITNRIIILWYRLKLMLTAKRKERLGGLKNV